MREEETYMTPPPPRAGMRRLSRVAAIAGLSLLIAGSAAAATVTFSNISGVWIGATGGSNVRGLGTNALSWGGESTNRSGYTFQPAPNAEARPARVDESVSLGTFTHENFVIPSGTAISDASLAVTADVTFAGRPSPLQMASIFDFRHLETTNTADPCSNGMPNWRGLNINGCADRVRVSRNESVGRSVIVDGTPYILQELDFRVGETLVSEFWTIENATNTAVLRGSVSPGQSGVSIAATQAVAPVPIPGAGVLMAGALAGLGLVARRRRASA
jgi:hypothetical protein